MRGTETILLVDDEPIVLKSTSAVLRNFDYTVLEADSGLQAIKLLREPNSIKLLITDIEMPGMRGPELARMAMRIRPGLPVLFISGYYDQAGFESLMGQEGLDFLPKPVYPRLLASHVRALLDQRRTMSAAGGRFAA